jgi:hypothetical protein
LRSWYVGRYMLNLVNGNEILGIAELVRGKGILISHLERLLFWKGRRGALRSCRW